MPDLFLPKHGVTSGISLSEEQIQKFFAFIKDKKPEIGKVFHAGKKVENKKYRDVEIFFIDEAQEDLYQILNTVATTVNLYFRYEIDGIEKAQIMKYSAPSQGYNWHIDIGAEGIALNRKIGVSILLNDDYKGGEIMFRSGDKEEGIKPSTGKMVAFSSFISHKVNPITKGDRYVVVAWFTGPPFK
jgi:PKHD-type hydroxylase